MTNETQQKRQRSRATTFQHNYIIPFLSMPIPKDKVAHMTWKKKTLRHWRRCLNNHRLQYKPKLLQTSSWSTLWVFLHTSIRNDSARQRCPDYQVSLWAAHNRSWKNSKPYQIAGQILFFKRLAISAIAPSLVVLRTTVNFKLPRLQEAITLWHTQKPVIVNE